MTHSKNSTKKEVKVDEQIEEEEKEPQLSEFDDIDVINKEIKLFEHGQSEIIESSQRNTIIVKNEWNFEEEEK